MHAFSNLATSGGHSGVAFSIYPLQTPFFELRHLEGGVGRGVFILCPLFIFATSGGQFEVANAFSASEWNFCALSFIPFWPFCPRSASSR